jgi:pyrimidine-nucleoside phosphorylase
VQVSELIAKKQSGGILAPEEIDRLVQGFTAGDVPDYQMSALLMAIYFQGLDNDEGRRFLSAMIASGDRMSLKSVTGFKVDKHSTGGVGDKTSLIVAPVVAAAGIPVPMISGRALGHTGGTLDKLESIPGFRVRLSEAEFEDVLQRHSCAFGAQTDDLVPADRKLYALRDVTATVSIPPLIAASILSKKIAEGTNALVMDVKVGEGGFLRSQEEAERLSKMLVSWSAAEKVETVVFGTDMSAPLGRCAGNGPEVAECLDVLKTGTGDKRLLELCGVLGGAMLWLGKIAKDMSAGRAEFEKILRSGDGYSKFCEIAIAQGARGTDLDDFGKCVVPEHRREIRATADGILRAIQPREVGWGLVDLGAGRRTADDPVDATAGVEFRKQVGDSVRKGDVLAVAQWSGSRDSAESGVQRITQAMELGDEPPAAVSLLKFYCDGDGLKQFE